MKNQDFFYNSLPKVKDCNFILQLKNLKGISLENSDLHPFPFPCSKELKMWQPAALLPQASSAQQFCNIRLRKIPQVSKKIDFQIQHSLSSSKKELPHQLTGCLQICSLLHPLALCLPPVIRTYRKHFSRLCCDKGSIQIKPCHLGEKAPKKASHPHSPTTHNQHYLPYFLFIYFFITFYPIFHSRAHGSIYSIVCSSLPFFT